MGNRLDCSALGTIVPISLRGCYLAENRDPSKSLHTGLKQYELYSIMESETFVGSGKREGRPHMQTPETNPDVDDMAPDTPILTGYDEAHLITYLRLLDAAEENADWREVARIVLHIDPEHEPDRAFKAWESHLARARWMTTTGYMHLLRGGAPH